MAGTDAELRDARILVVDDDVDTLDVMCILLEAHGADTVGATSAAEGLTALSSFRPHLVVSDIAMPGQDGYALIRKIRALPTELGGDTPAVAVSAHVYREDRERAYAAGFQAYLTKPINPSALIECVGSLFLRVKAQLERRHAERRRHRASSAGRGERRSFQRRQPVRS